MPGKVNPVIPEVVNQICFMVIGNDVTISMAAEAGQLELNVMEPIILFTLYRNIEMLTRGSRTLARRCVGGITANVDVCRRHVEMSIGLVTALVPVLGYERAAQIAKTALHTGKGVAEIVLEEGIISKEELDDLLRPENMLQQRSLLPHRA
jgi:aspartate ammonia-lyase